MTDPITARLRSDLITARKAKDRHRTTLLTMTLSELRNREIELRRELEEEDAVGVLSSAVKRRREAAEQMAAAGRDELAAKEEREAELLSAYLPEPMSEEEVRRMVREVVDSGVDTLGAVMGAVMPKIKGRFDGKEANRIVREELGG